MGKKDKKKKNPSVQEKKKQKQQEKAKKKAAKGDGGAKELAEEDIEAILAEFRAKEATKTAVTINLCAQPTPRANFSLTTLPNGELLLFGGEYYDGDVSTCYNDVFRWNIEKQEWRQIISINTPPPRCSHQAVCFRDHVYVFGGEFSTSDQFYHYKDWWRLDLKTNQWEELPLQKETPSARSGHRMAVFRNYILLFGGFYEAFRETRWFNDLYVYSLQDLKWRKVQFASHALAPAPRSGCQMVVSSVGDCAFIYGGYSKVKQQPPTTGGTKSGGGGGSGAAAGKVHDDLWVLQLKNLPNGGQPYWERASRKGSPPSSRSGASMVGYRTIALLFGGVHDVEGKQHTMQSHFYADLYQLDLVRKKWFEVNLRGTAAGGGKRRRTTNNKQAHKGGEGQDGGGDDDDDAAAAGKEEEEEDRDGAFAFIDQDGNVVYLHDDEDEDEEEGDLPEEGQGQQHQEAPPPPPPQGVDASSSPKTAPPPPPLEVVRGEEGKAVVRDQHQQHQGGAKGGSSVAVEDKGGPTAGKKQEATPGVENNNNHQQGRKGRRQQQDEEENEDDGGGGAVVKGGGAAAPVIKLVEREGGGVGEGLALVDGQGRVGPIPRINAALTMRGHMLFVYGGVFEDGDREVTCDDAWCLDLNRREAWQCLLPGTMHEQVWKSESDDDDDGDDDSDDDDEDDDSDDDSEGESGDEEEGNEEEEEGVVLEAVVEDEEGEDEEGEDEDKKKKDKKNNKKKKDKSKKEEEERGQEGGGRDRSGRRLKHAGSSASVRGEIEELQARLSVDDAQRTPQMGEKLRDFFARTTEYWTRLAVDEVERQQQKAEQEAAATTTAISTPSSSLSGGGSADEVQLREKKYRRLAFQLAGVRFEEVRPVLERLDELEREQREAEQSMAAAGGGRKGGGGGRSSGKGSRR